MTEVVDGSRRARPPEAFVVQAVMPAVGAATLALGGELDLAAVPQLRAAFDALAVLHPGDLLVDLRGLSFLDASGLHALQHMATARPGMAFIPAPAHVQALFALVGLADTLTFVDAPSAAGSRPVGEREDLALRTALHDVRSPLMALRYIGEDLERGIGEPRIFGGQVQQEAGRAMRMLADIRPGAHDGDQQDPVIRVRAPVDLVAVVEEALVRARRRAQSTGEHSFSVELPSAPLAARVDRDDVTRALVNLLTNAATYSRAGSAIHVSLARDTDDALLIVTDEGMGIPAEEVERVAHPLHRTTESSAAGIAGSGLGLALVQRVADDHRSSLTISSRPGIGSTFTLRLPIGD